MSQDNYSELLSAYLDGEVEGEELNRVNLLLASSAEARQELERLQETKSVLSTAPRMAAPADLVALLLANPRLQQRQKVAWWQKLVPAAPRWAWASAGATAAAFGVFITLTAPWAPEPLPLEPFLAAHARQRAAEPGLHGTLVAASNYSSLLATQNEPRS